jgi:hypothetical protein
VAKSIYFLLHNSPVEINFGFSALAVEKSIYFFFKDSPVEINIKVFSTTAFALCSGQIYLFLA